MFSKSIRIFIEKNLLRKKNMFRSKMFFTLAASALLTLCFCTAESIQYHEDTIEKLPPCKKIDLGKMYCDDNGKLRADDLMKATHERCPPDPKAKKINWSSIDSANCTQMLDLGKLFAVQYQCMYRLYGAYSVEGGLNPMQSMRYANAIEPRRASRFLKYRLRDCIERYSVAGSGFGREVIVARNWTKFSACQVSAELRACNTRRSFKNDCVSVW